MRSSSTRALEAEVPQRRQRWPPQLEPLTRAARRSGTEGRSKGEFAITEATGLKSAQVLKTLLDTWSGDLDITEQRLLAPLAEQLGHVEDEASPGSNEGPLVWRCIDHVTRVHIPVWLDAAPQPERAASLKGIAPIVDATSAQAASLVLEELHSMLADRRRASRDVVQKETWSSAWTSAWNVESSARWAYARDASLGAAATSSWRTALAGARRSGSFALCHAAQVGQDVVRDALRELLSELTNELITEVAWSAAWQPTWVVATASNYVPRLDLDRAALDAARDAIDPIVKALFEETLLFVGELVQIVI